MTDLIQVEDNKDLARDPFSNAIINTDRTALEKYKAEKAKRINDRKRLDTLEQKVDLILSLLMDKK